MVHSSRPVSPWSTGLVALPDRASEPSARKSEKVVAACSTTATLARSGRKPTVFTCTADGDSHEPPFHFSVPDVQDESDEQAAPPNARQPTSRARARNEMDSGIREYLRVVGGRVVARSGSRPIA